MQQSDRRMIFVTSSPLADETAEVRPRLRGWSHLVAAIAAVVLCPLVIVASPGSRAVVAIFAASVIGLFATSGSYHCFGWGTRAHEFFRRADHSVIFVVIAATYTPIAVAALPGGLARTLLWAVWLGAAGGVGVQLFWPRAPRGLIVALYLIVGWASLPVIHLFWQRLGVAGFMLVLLGGVLHTIGAVIYGTQRPDPWPRWFGFHEIFHVLVIAAVASHYVVVAFIA